MVVEPLSCTISEICFYSETKLHEFIFEKLIGGSFIILSEKFTII